MDYRTDLFFSVDGTVGRETSLRAEYLGGRVLSIGVRRPDGKLELITRFGNDTTGVLKMAIPELVSREEERSERNRYSRPTNAAFSGGRAPHRHRHDRRPSGRDESRGLDQNSGRREAAQHRLLGARLG